MELLKMLDSPAKEYTPIPFWFLNDRLERDEIRRQLKDFCSHGVWGVVLHPRIGMDPKVDYLSPAFFAGLRASVIHGRFAQNVTFSEPLTNPLSIQPIIIQVPSSLLPLRYRSAMMKIALYHSLLFINHPVS